MSRQTPETPVPAPASASASASAPTETGTASSATSPPSAPEQHGVPPYHGTPAWMHGASVAAAVLGPVGLMLPPRRMGVRSLLLAGGTFFASSQLTYDYTGQSLYQRFQLRMSQMTGSDLPEAAVQRQAAMRAERERRQRLRLEAAAGGEDAQSQSQPQGKLHKIWMGNEKDGWTRERAQREKEVLDAGGGYWELIIEQIGDVWTDLTKKKSSSSSKEGGAEATNPDENARQPKR